MSVVLSLITAGLFAVAILIGTEKSQGLESPPHEPCPCDRTNAFCDAPLDYVRHFCQDKEEYDGTPDVLGRTPNVLGYLFSVAGLILLFATFASCCCCGFLQSGHPLADMMPGGYPFTQSVPPPRAANSYERRHQPSVERPVNIVMTTGNGNQVVVENRPHS